MTMLMLAACAQTMKMLMLAAHVQIMVMYNLTSFIFIKVQPLCNLMAILLIYLN